MYDVNSALPYTKPNGERYANVKKLHSAFRHGRSSAFTRIEAQDWSTVAHQLGLPPELVIHRVRDIVARTPDAIESASLRVVERAHLGSAKATDWRRILGRYYESLHQTVVA